MRNRLIVTAIATAFLASAALLPVRINAQTLDVGGRVRITGSSRAPVRVRLQRLGETIQEQFSIDGMFQFRNVPLGLYTLTVEAPGYESVFRYVEVPGDFDVLVELGGNESGSREVPATASVFEHQIPSSARREFEAAQRRIQDGDCKGALNRLRKAIQIFAKYADAHNAAGACYLLLNEMALAQEAYKEAAGLTSSVYPALNLADIYTKQRRIREAEEVLTTAIRRNPLAGDGYLGLAALRVEQNRLTEAEELAREAHRRPIHAPDVHILLAKVYLATGRSQEIPAELRLYVTEAKPGALRDRIEKSLSDLAGKGKDTRIK